MHVAHTDSDVVYGFRGSARRTEVAGGCASQYVMTLSQNDDGISGQDDSLAVSPCVTRFRVTIRHTCQLDTRLQ